MTHLMNTISTKDDIVVTRGDGSYFVDEADNRYLDFFTDSGTASLGHGGAEHQAARQKMEDHQYPLHALNMFDHELRSKVAEKVCRATGYDKIFFSNSGAESVETAIKLARKYQADKMDFAKNQIWSIRGSFHGRTYGALAASDGPLYHFNGFHPLPGSFYFFYEIEQIDFSLAAAVIISPVYCNNDVKLYPTEWLKYLRERCKATGTLLIYDEIQTGSGRVGDYTYAKTINVEPDILLLAKGFGMGCPVAATLAKDDIAKAFTPGTHFTTFGGSPLALVYVDSMFDWLEANRSGIRAIGEEMLRDLRNSKWTKDVRGVGMFIAFDIEGDAMEFASGCLDEGLVIGAFRSNPVKITPPLNLAISEWQHGLRIMRKVAARIGGNSC